MRVLLNAHSLLDYHLTGVSYYTWHLLNGMTGSPAVRALYPFNHHRLVKFYPARSRGKEHKKKKLYKDLAESSRFKRWFSQTDETFTHFSSKPVARKFTYMETNFIVSPFQGPCVTTLHDLTCLRFPELQPEETVAWFEAGLNQTLAQATHFITVSEFIRKEAIKYLSIPEHKVTAVYNGVSSEFRPRDCEEIVQDLTKHQLQFKKYLLSVCTLEPRKNLQNLLNAYSHLPENIRQEFPLVLVGAIGWKVKDLIKNIKLMDNVLLLGYLPQEEIYSVFSGAKAFCYLSTYEGFGLPVLEALASGVPVVTSQETAMAEFSHEHALLVEPLDIQAITQALSQLVADNILEQKTLDAAQHYRQTFSWEHCVNKTLAVIEKVSMS